MKSKQTLFLVTCAAITAGLIWVYAVFSAHFAVNPEDHARVGKIARELQREKFRRALAESRLRDFSQDVAQVLPAETKLRLAKQSREMNQLGETLREPASIPLDLSGVTFERAKKLFGDKKYPEAIGEFRKLIETFPLSPHVIESHFLLGEASYLSGHAKECVDTVDTMVTHFPDNDLTGFLLLRMGQISEHESRVEEANEIYHIVEKNFKTPALKEQARKMARAVEDQ